MFSFLIGKRVTISEACQIDYIGLVSVKTGEIFTVFFFFEEQLYGLSI